MHSPKRVLTVCGSLQAESSNLNLLADLTPVGSGRVELVHSDDLRSLPLFNPDLLGSDLPEPVESWRAGLAQADAVVIASPEYGHSLPGALKNGIDWVIGSGELHDKVVAITASVRHASRGLLGLSALRQTLLAIDVRLVWDRPIVAGNGRDRDLGQLIETLLAAMSR